MGKLPNHLKTSAMLTPKQRKFVDVLVANWGKMSKAAAVREAGYTPKRDNGASEIGSKLTNPNKCPHVVRYLEKRLQAEMAVYEKDKLRSYKQYDRRIDPQDRGLPFSTAVPLSVVLESRPTNNRPSLYHLMI
jgi:hypothetical protein